MANTSSLPFRNPSRQQSRQMSLDPREDLRVEKTHYIGIDVGTGSARAAIMSDDGTIVALASENIALYQPQTGWYEQSTTNIWNCICTSIHRAMAQHNIDPNSIRGIGFDATCSLSVFDDDDKPVAVTGPKFDNADGLDRNVILWLDHRPVEETKKINATNHNLLRYVGGQMSIEMVGQTEHT